MRFRPANIRLINRRQNLPRLLLALSLKDDKSKDNDKNNPIDVQKLTGHSISGSYRDCPGARIMGLSPRCFSGAVSIGSFEVSRWRGGRGDLAMEFQLVPDW